MKESPREIIGLRFQKNSKSERRLQGKLVVAGGIPPCPVRRQCI